jgi:lipoprotein-releasing system permease protein
MYRLLLCWRYLRTRYIALASIVSVMLGVATMIVVNAVMSGFANEMQSRIHGILSDVVLESANFDGFPDAAWHMDRIRQAAGDSIQGMTPTVVVPAMLYFRVGDNKITRQVELIGIDEKTQADVSDFARYLQHPQNRMPGGLSFELRQAGYDVIDHQPNSGAKPRNEMALAGWKHRIRMAELEEFRMKLFKPGGGLKSALPGGPAEKAGAEAVKDPFAAAPPAAALPQSETFDAKKQQHAGLIMGIALASFRTPDGTDNFRVLPGDDVKLTVPRAGLGAGALTGPAVIEDDFTIVDFYESKMSEYDSCFVFVPIRELQRLRGTIDPSSGVGLVNSIQIKLKPGADGAAVRDKLRAAFQPGLYAVSTWRDKQGALLQAVTMETAILNVLLFMIIAVAGFGILAIFLMIVVEKTKDIGVLKSLGASGTGIMGIFLGYGLSLGVAGSGVGMVMGLLFVRYINQVADVLSWVTGQRVFDPSIYYFYRIPTVVYPKTIAWIVLGALAIAVLASILPAIRAARLHPVEALRYE